MKRLLLCLFCLTLVGLNANSQTPTTRRVQFVIVDEKNHSLDDVQVQDIEVWENGVSQQATIEKLHTATRYALVVDTSGSMRSQFPNVLETARAFVRTNKDHDETALVRFVSSTTIQTAQTFTTDKQLLMSKIDRLYLEGGHTALVDAIYSSVLYVEQEAKNGPTKNHALVLITDGENRDSTRTLDELLKLVRTKSIPIYTIGLTAELDKESGLISKAPQEKAEKLLQNLAKNTGGRAFFVKKGADFPNAISEVIRDLRTFYVASFTSTSEIQNSKIEIKVAKSADKKNRKAIFNSFVNN
jgi:VWFA-related protein